MYKFSGQVLEHLIVLPDQKKAVSKEDIAGEFRIGQVEHAAGPNAAAYELQIPATFTE